VREQKGVSVSQPKTQVAADDLVDKETVRSIYERVTKIATTEARLVKGLTAGEFQFVFYPSRGQEMIPAGAVQALRPDDYMVTTYRALHDVIAKGVPLREIVAEFLGRATGTSKGKGGPMHISSPGAGLMVTTGIVGSGVPIANGLAYAAQAQGTGQVALVSFGDGATSIGAVHEAFNLAGLWDLPVIFMLQNNQFGEHTTIAGYTKTERLADRAAPYGIRAVTIDGNDPIAVMRAVDVAAAHARAGGGPTLIEAVTYRLSGHAFGAPAKYMDKAELQAAWDADPVPRFRNRILASGALDERELDGIDREISDEVEDAVQFALASPPPDLDELCLDVFADEKDVLR
jgi:TPP-dependent pyruvate/acetoin dehydrogenase alpha subunit